MSKRKLGRKINHRKSLLRNLATSLILYEKVDTTLPKAKEVRSTVEKIITTAKSNDLTAFRKLFSFFYDKNAARKVIKELVPRYKDRQSGYVRIFQMKNRLGDNSPLARIELIDRKVFIKPEEVKKAETKKTEKEIKSEKIDKKSLKTLRKLDKLSATREKSGVVTSVRTKAARKTGV